MWIGERGAGPRLVLPPQSSCFLSPPCFCSQWRERYLRLKSTQLLPKLNLNHHGICKQLCTGGLRAGQEKEGPRRHGSDWKVLWRGQKEEEQGEERRDGEASISFSYVPRLSQILLRYSPLRDWSLLTIFFLDHT